MDGVPLSFRRCASAGLCRSDTRARTDEDTCLAGMPRYTRRRVCGSCSGLGPVPSTESAGRSTPESGSLYPLRQGHVQCKHKDTCSTLARKHHGCPQCVDNFYGHSIYSWSRPEPSAPDPASRWTRTHGECRPRLSRGLWKDPFTCRSQRLGETRNSRAPRSGLLLDWRVHQWVLSRSTSRVTHLLRYVGHRLTPLPCRVPVQGPNPPTRSGTIDFQSHPYSQVSGPERAS